MCRRRTVLHSLQPGQSRCRIICASRLAHGQSAAPLWCAASCRPSRWLSPCAPSSTPSTRNFRSPRSSPWIDVVGGRPGVAPLQHRADLRFCGGGRAAGSARHLQRHRLFHGVAHAGDGHPPGARLAALQRDAADPGFRRKAGPGRLRYRRHRRGLCHSPAALAAVSRSIRWTRWCWCLPPSPFFCWRSRPR